MAHVRKQIRDAIETAVTGLATTGANVFGSRVYPIEVSTLPCLAVYTSEESIEHLTMNRGSRETQRVLNVVVAGVAQAAANLDDTLDTIIKEVETAIAADPTLGGIARDCMLTEIAIEMDASGEKPTGTARMTWTTVYHVAENAVETAL